MAPTPTHHDEEPRPRPPETRTLLRDEDEERSEEERLELEQERIAAASDDVPRPADELPLEGFELREGDEDIEELQTASLLDETPVPDDAHLADFERQGQVRPAPTGPPTHHRLSAIPEEMGARVLEGLTQSDPTDQQEERELFDTLPNDKALDIRGGEDEAVPPEEIPSRSPSTPTGSPDE